MATENNNNDQQTSEKEPENPQKSFPGRVYNGELYCNCEGNWKAKCWTVTKATATRGKKCSLSSTLASLYYALELTLYRLEMPQERSRSMWLLDLGRGRKGSKRMAIQIWPSSTTTGNSGFQRKGNGRFCCF